MEQRKAAGTVQGRVGRGGPTGPAGAHRSGQDRSRDGCSRYCEDSTKERIRIETERLPGRSDRPAPGPDGRAGPTAPPPLGALLERRGAALLPRPERLVARRDRKFFLLYLLFNNSMIAKYI